MSSIECGFNQDFMHAVSQVVNDCGLNLTIRTTDALNISDPYQMDFFLALTLDASHLAIINFTFRTNSFFYEGERTDLHDSHSLLFSMCGAMQGYSISLWDVENNFSEIESELYARYATVGQPNHSVITQDEAGIEQLKSILALYINYRTFLSTYYKNSEKPMYTWDKPELRSLGLAIGNILSVEIDDVVVNERKGPDWTYLQVYKLGLSGVKSEFIGRFFAKASQAGMAIRNELKDDKNIYQKNAYLRLCYSDLEEKSLRTLATELSNDVPLFFASESHLFCLAGNWLLAQRGNFGLARFNKEREEFSRVIHRKIEFLFDHAPLYWNEKGSADVFEQLCRDLLAREQGVVRVRNVSPTNQPDRGRDLIAEIATSKPVGDLLNENEQPIKIEKYVVQCKLSKATVGIPRGTGPFEVLYLGDYDGYFLITNSKISSDFTALLEKIRSDDRYSADWWGAAQLEERLRANPDLIQKYRNLVSYGEF